MSQILERRPSSPGCCLVPFLGSFHLSQTISVTWGGDTKGALFPSALSFLLFSWFLFSFLSPSPVLLLLSCPCSLWPLGCKGALPTPAGVSGFDQVLTSLALPHPLRFKPR